MDSDRSDHLSGKQEHPEMLETTLRAEAISVFPQVPGQSMAAEELAGLRVELRDFIVAENARLQEVKDLLRSYGTPASQALLDQLTKAPGEVSRRVHDGELSPFEALEEMRDLCHQATILLATKERASRPISRVMNRAQILIQEMTKYSSMHTSDVIKLLSALEGTELKAQQAIRAMERAAQIDQSLKFESQARDHARLINTTQRAWR